MAERADYTEYINTETKKRNAYFEKLDAQLRDALGAIDTMIERMFQEGVITEVQAKKLHQHFEAYLVGWEMVQWILHEKPQGENVDDCTNRTYLIYWLANHPSFYDDILKEKWPEWLPKPS